MNNMKDVLFKFTIVFLLGLTACNHSVHQVAEYLSQAEALVWTAPDSSLHILKSISNPEKLKGQEQADYALLLTLTRYRCCIPISSDSLINIAMEYYKGKDDMNKRGAVLYVRGCILQEIQNDETNALIAYKEAEGCMRHTGEQHYIAHIYSSLGYLNHVSSNFELAKEYYSKALQVNIAVKDTASQASNLLNLFGLYHVNQQVDSINWCINSLSQIGKSVKDSALLSKIYHNIAVYRMYQDKIEEAEEYLSYALQVSPVHTSYKILAELANLYTQKGNKARADSLYESALKSGELSTRAYIYDNLYKEALASENYKEVARYVQLYIATSDSFYTDNRHKEVLKIQKEYDRMQLLYQNTKLKNGWLLTVFLAILIFCASSYCFKIFQKKLRIKNRQLQLEIKSLYNTLVKEEALYNENQLQLQSQIDTLLFGLKNEVTYAAEKEEEEEEEEETALQNEVDRLKLEKIKNEAIYCREQQTLQQQLKVLMQREEEVEKINNRFMAVYGKNNSLDIEDVKALQVALNLNQNRTCNLSGDRENLKHWLNLSRNGFANKLHIVYPMLEGTLLDVCYLAAAGLSLNEIALTLNVQERSVERYMSSICQSVKCTRSGKKGFWEFINSLTTF